MEKLVQKHDQLIKALASLDLAINNYQRFNRDKVSCIDIDISEMNRIFRDSMIHRFEYCTDLFWKFIKKYLEVNHQYGGIKTSREVLKEAFSVGILDEAEFEKIITMIQSRNMTSHIYVEEIAEQLAQIIPDYYLALHSIVSQVKL